MIIENGVDIVKVARIEKLLAEKRDRFLNKVFTAEEIKYIEDRNYNPQTVSGIFAAKEAVSKLLGTGIGKVNWKDIEIIQYEGGRPGIRLHGEGLNACHRLGINKISLSISHEKEYALAFVSGVGEGYGKEIFVPQYIKEMLPKREKESHKGTYGRVGIIAGSLGMTGAAYLATMAALRSGSGLVYTIVPESLCQILSSKLIEAIIKPIEDEGKGHFTQKGLKKVKQIINALDILVLGPGIGVDEDRIGFVSEILLNYEGPIVLDADGLNCISQGKQELLLERKGATIITPHPGELSRLIGVSIKEIQKNRLEYSKEVSNKYNIITVLKGANTIVSNPKGEVFINPTGNPGMATAGSGDVLAGMIASFVGQGIMPYEACILGVYCHGLAGDLAKLDKGEYGMIASDILDKIPYSIGKLEY